MRIAVSILGAVLLALAACSGPGSVKDAAPKVAEFHRQLDAGDFEAIWNGAGEDIKKGGKADFLDLLQRAHAQMGKVKASKQTGWRSEVNTTGSFAQVRLPRTPSAGNPAPS